MVSVVHGRIIQRLMIDPIKELAAPDGRFPGPVLRLIPLLLQFSTVCWLLGGIALIAAPFWFDAPTRLTLAVVVGAFYAFGALGNLWATRGRHFGWMLLAVAVALIWYGA